MHTDDHSDKVEHVWQLLEKIGFCMLATRDGQEIRARPMSAHLEREEQAIYFLTDVHSHKDEEIERDPHVGLFFADPGNQKYLSLTGRAQVTNDRAKIKELWSTPAKAWWDDPEDPAIRVLKITPHDAQYWDSPGTVMSSIKMLAAAVSDARPDMGDNEKVKL